jgi:hypothetical protein
MDSHRPLGNQLFGLLLVLLTFTGCASAYREPALSQNETACINATAPVWIVTIDGKKVSRAGVSGHKQFRVSTGRHLVEVQYSEIGKPISGIPYAARDRIVSQKNVPLSFVASAGKNYYVKEGRSGYAWNPFITDSLGPIYLH